jgi:YD repeat-containing protein
VGQPRPLKWTTSWLSYATDNLDVNGSVDLYRRGGGDELFSFDKGQMQSKVSQLSQSTLTRIVDASGATARFERSLPDGSTEIFARAMGTKFFLTRAIDPQGHAIEIGYDDQLRIVSLTDALKQVTKLSYEARRQARSRSPGEHQRVQLRRRAATHRHPRCGRPSYAAQLHVGRPDRERHGSEWK